MCDPVSDTLEGLCSSADNLGRWVTAQVTSSMFSLAVRTLVQTPGVQETGDVMFCFTQLWFQYEIFYPVLWSGLKLCSNDYSKTSEQRTHWGQASCSL